MPLPVVRSGSPRVYLPGYRSLSTSGYDQAVKAYQSRGPSYTPYNQFEPGQLAKQQSGGIQLNASELISMGVKEPAYAAEAPLRLPDVATGGLISKVATGVTDVISKIPVLSDILGAVGNGLKELDYAGASMPNYFTAEALKNGIGKPDNAPIDAGLAGLFLNTESLSGNMNMGDLRQQLSQLWGTDYEGNQYSIDQLEARARENSLNFGQFAVNADPAQETITRLLVNPMNLLMVPGLAGGAARAGAAGVRLAAGTDAALQSAAGARYLLGAARASSWARPVIKPGMLVARPFRYGYGYASSLGRGVATALHEAHSPNPFRTEFADLTNATQTVMQGGLRGQGTVHSTLNALAAFSRGARVVGQKVYFPGVNAELSGARLAGSATRAWMRGGIQQQIVGIGAEQLFGGLDAYFQENQQGHTVQGHIANELHNALAQVNNDHPLSDHQAFVVAALFLPAFGAARDIAAEPGRALRTAREPLYVDNVLGNLRNKLNTDFGQSFTNDSLLAEIGGGDAARGAQMLEYYVEKMEVLKTENQLAHLTHLIMDGEIDGLAVRNEYIADIVKNNVIRRRASGALRPGSTVDYMIEKHQEAGRVNASGVELASDVTGTADSFIREIQNTYHAYEVLGPQLKGLGLDIAKGGVLDRESLQAILEEVKLTPEGLIDQNYARQIVDMAPSLVYEDEFWREFALTLGQKMHGGRLGREARLAEDVTKEDVVAQLEALIEHVPSQQELFHETLAASKAQGVAKNDVFRIKEPPYPMAAKMKANRAKSTDKVMQYADNERMLQQMRDTEFFKSGKPKFEAAAEIVGPEGGLFKRVEPLKGEAPVPAAPEVPAGEPTTAIISYMEDLSKGEVKQEIVKIKNTLDETERDFIADKELRGEPLSRIIKIVPERPVLRLSSEGPFATHVGDVPPEMAPSADFLTEYKKGTPDSITAYKKDLHPGFNEVVTVWRNEEGIPKGYAQVIGNKKGPTGLSTYVDPAYRRQGVATRLYEKLQAEGVELGRISGTTVTAEGRAFSESFRESRPEVPAYRRTSDGLDLSINRGVIKMTIPAAKEEALLAELKKTIFKSGPRKGQIKPDMVAESQRLNLQIEALRLGIDEEALVLAVQHNGRVLIADRTAGPLLASYGFRESSAIRGSSQAAFSYRGGAPTELLKNHAAGAFQPYRATRREATLRGSVGNARYDAISGSMTVPSDAYLGKAGDPVQTLFPAERRRFIQENLGAAKKGYMNELKKVSEMDDIALGVLPFDRKLSEMGLHDWMDGLSNTEYAKFRDFLSTSYAEFPNLSLVPRSTNHMVVDPASSRWATLVTQHNRMQDLLIDYGPLSPIQKLYDALAAPLHVRWLGKQTQTEFHNLLASVGVSPNASREFVAELRKRILESKSVVGYTSLTQSHFYGSFQALPEETMRSIARELFPSQAEAVLEKYGSYQKMLTEASNRLLRTASQSARRGGRVNRIEAAADASMRLYQYGPGIAKVSTGTRYLSKFVYPLIRFYGDPLFAMMNWMEPYMYNVLNNGWRGLTPASAGAERRADLSAAGIIPPGGLYAKEVPAELLMADPGFFTIPKPIRPNMIREFELTTEKRAQQYFEAMGPEHPVAVMLRQRFGENPKDWASEVNRMMESLVRKGPEDTIRAEWTAVLEKEMGLSHAELKTLAPVAERLTEVYRGAYQDLANLYIGRMSRSNVERLANNFFLLWPASYMIKATSWMYRVLFEKIGPVPGAAGAYAWDEYRKMIESHIAANPEFGNFMEDNRDFLFALEMMVPITPLNIGVSLGRPTRYVGSWVSPEIFGEYGVKPGDIPAVVEGSLRFGPIRSWKLVNKMLESWHVPGFYQETYHPPTTLLP